MTDFSTLNLIPMNPLKSVSNFVQKAFLGMVLFLAFVSANGQTAKDVAILSVYSGYETGNIVYRVESKEIPSLKFIRAQRIGGQKGFFTQYKDNIRFISESKVEGIPGNLSTIRFTFLQADMRTPIEKNDFRVIINDIDGPNNEMLSTSCENNVRWVGTAYETNLVVDSSSPSLSARGAFDEKDGHTSRVMFEFGGVDFIEFDNYANNGYLKDFDFNNDYAIAEPKMVKCKDPNAVENNLAMALAPLSKDAFAFNNNMMVIATNPIYFDEDKWDITEKAAKELMKVVVAMERFPNLKVDLGSHTDSRGDREYNRWLSEKRAQSSFKWIVMQGIDPVRITAEGYGEERLVNDCKDNVKCSAEEHQANRRTEFVIVNPQAIVKSNLRTLVTRN